LVTGKNQSMCSKCRGSFISTSTLHQVGLYHGLLVGWWSVGCVGWAVVVGAVGWLVVCWCLVHI